MKLLSKYNRINILATILILLLSSVAYYFVIRKTLIHQLDKDLKIEQKELREFVKENNNLPEPTDYKDQQEFYNPISDSLPTKFKSINIYDHQHHEDIYYRELSFCLKLNNQFYQIIVRKSQEETEDIIKIILFLTLAVVLILLVALLLINRFMFNKLWKPFTNTLNHLQKFDIAQNKPLILPSTSIDEFTRLNETVTIMSNKAVKDYNEIRNFTENASHEIQTPLAIIKSRLELLSQGDGLKEDQMNNIQSIFDAANRLSRLNQSLLLLTKIDNKQFHDLQEIDLTYITNKILLNYEELLSANQISLDTKINKNIIIKMNESLAEILISNLLTNAIRHNIHKGFIKILLDQEKLLISNSGKSLEVPADKLFERFRKEKATSESLGLGLSIVKKIVETYNFRIHYNCIDTIHTVTIFFKQSPDLLQN